MNSIAFVNGVYSPIEEAKVSILDRGYYFGDGVYDVVLFFNHKPFAMDDHLNRFEYSCREMGITSPYTRGELAAILQEACDKVEGEEHCVYFQLTRGIAPRTHTYPEKHVKGSFMLTVNRHAFDPETFEKGMRVKSYPDIRWGRCDIKTLNLIPNTMYNQRAKDDGVDEAIFVRDGHVTEFTCRSAFMVKDGVVITHPQDHEVLVGTTRNHVVALCRELGIPVEERLYTLEEAYAADEFFATSVVDRPSSVVEIDGHVIGDGQVGRVVKRLRRAYHQRVLDQCGPTYFDRYFE